MPTKKKLSWHIGTKLTKNHAVRKMHDVAAYAHTSHDEKSLYDSH